MKGFLGAIIGDIAGSRFEWHNHKSTDFELFINKCDFTDDTVMTIAAAKWLLDGRKGDLAEIMRDWGRRYPNRGYGGMFYQWIYSDDPDKHLPYNSFGNGSGMRVSPVGFYAKSLEEAADLAKQTADVSHNHPEGIKGAQSIATAIYLARTGKTKAEIKSWIEDTYHYDLSRTCDEIRPTYKFDVTCQGSCPEAIIAFLESTDFESAIRLAISLGGDSDTIACMTGGIAAAAYSIPDEIGRKALEYLSTEMQDIITKFNVITSLCAQK